MPCKHCNCHKMIFSHVKTSFHISIKLKLHSSKDLIFPNPCLPLEFGRRRRSRSSHITRVVVQYDNREKMKVWIVRRIGGDSGLHSWISVGEFWLKMKLIIGTSSRRRSSCLDDGLVLVVVEQNEFLAKFMSSSVKTSKLEEATWIEC